MKKLFSLLSLALLMAACSGSDVTEDNASGTMEETITQRSCTVSEGEEVSASTTTVITIAYNTTVAVSSSAQVTLNGTKVTPTSNAVTTMSIDIPVSLEGGTSYTLVVPSGTVIATSDANKTAPAFTLNFTTKATATATLPDNTAMEVTRTLGFGWNLGNHFDSHNNGEPVPESWGSWWDQATPTAALYQALAAAGVSSVRLPVTWGAWQGTSPTYTIDSSYMALIRSNVEWARDAGLNVILNTHHDEFWLDIYSAAYSATVNAEIEERLVATWTQIAEEFKDEGDYLFFETFNEIHGDDGTTEDWGTGYSTKDGGLQYATLNEWNQLAVNTIRATGSNNASRWIMVPGYAASPSITMNTLVLPTDSANKLIVAVHCYDPYSFTLSSTLDETWGHTSGSATDESAITDLFAELKAAYIDQNIPCYLGEFGCSKHTTTKGEQCRAYYFEYFLRAAHDYGLAAMIWDNFVSGAGTECHAYFNHNDGSWMNDSEALVKTMIAALTSDDADYTLESIYNQAP